MTLNIIGAGFGRTGTRSLKEALEALGFDKCYHMSDLFAHPDHADIWTGAGQGQPIDWDALFEGYQATVDWPGCTFYKELMQRYPDAKVLLSVRDPEKWYTSVMNTIYGGVQSPFTKLEHALPRIRRIVHMHDTLIWNGAFHGRFEDKQYAIEVFNRHNEEVRRVVPPERLLVYEVKQGWEPLCQFLGVPVPDKPFPHLNDTADFQKMIRQRTRRTRLLAASSLTLVAALIGWLALRGRDTITR